MRVLLERLLDEPGLAYLLAFAQIGAIWLNHHRLFDQVRVVDGRLLVLNLNLLMWITLIPFPISGPVGHSLLDARRLFLGVAVAPGGKRGTRARTLNRRVTTTQRTTIWRQT